jgi:D-alanine-D-alanine ligase
MENVGSQESGWADVDRLVQQIRHRASDITVVVVANRKQQATNADYDGYSVETEYFSEEELEQIVGAMRHLGVYVRSYFSEDDFITAVLNGEIERLPRLHKLIYNSAQTGVGPGRKALIPSFCRLHDLPTTGSDAYVVSLARQKFHTASILRAVGVPTAPTWCYVARRGWLNGNRPSEGTRVIVKLTYESASIGMDEASLRTVDETLPSFLDDVAKRYEQPLTVQQFVAGAEVEVPVIGLAAPFTPMAVGISINGQRALGDAFLTYDLVYADKYEFYPFAERYADVIAAAARQAFETLGIRGFGRIDFRIDDQGGFYAIDVATNPHIIHHSSFAFTFRETGRRYEDLVGLLLALACDREGWL